MTLNFKSSNNEIDICSKYTASFKKEKKRQPNRLLANDLIFYDILAALCYL